MGNETEKSEASGVIAERTDRSRIWQTVLRLAVCIGILWFIFFRVDISEVYHLITRINFFYFVLAFLIYLVAHFFFLWRWKSILNALGISCKFTRLLNLQLVGLFFNLFLPTSAGGDVIKAYYVAKDTGKAGLSYISVFLDRYIGLLAVIAFAAVAAAAVRLSIGGNPVYQWLLLVFAGALLATILLSTQFAFQLNRFLGKRLKTVQTVISLINESSKAVLGNYWVVFWTFLLSIAFMLLVIVINYILIMAMGLTIKFTDLLVFIPLIAFAASLPISINGIGVREGAYIYLFSIVDFTSAESLSLALLSFSLLFLVSLPGSIVYLLMRRYNGQAQPDKYA